MNTWISTAEQLPEHDQRVLVWVRSPNSGKQVVRRGGELVLDDPDYVVSCRFVRGKVPKGGETICPGDGDQAFNNLVPYVWRHNGTYFFGQDVSHWMPLPEPPAK